MVWAVTGNPELARAVRRVVRDCLAVGPGEDVVVVADPASQRLGEMMRDEAQGAGGDAVLALMAEREIDGQEPPPTVAGAMAAADVFIAPASRSISHTKARRDATAAGARGATLPGVTEDMLARLMSGDFDVMRARSRAVAELLDDADEAHVACPRGTDLRLDLSGRRGIADDGDLSAGAAFGNLPCGEGFISPAGGEGRLFAKTVAAIGMAEEPIGLTVAGGRLDDAEGELGATLLSTLDQHGAQGRNVAELGVGTNEQAHLSGNVLEDEKILGTVHVAFGASASIGGTVQVGVHLDVVILDATLDIGGTRVLDAGRWALA